MSSSAIPSRVLTILAAATVGLLLPACAAAQTASSVKSLGVYVDADSDVQLLNDYGTERNTDSFTEGMRVSFPRTSGRAVVEVASFRGFYVNLPEARISDVQLYQLSTLDASWSAMRPAASDPQPIASVTDPVRNGVYRVAPGTPVSRKPKPTFIALRVPMPFGTPDRLYAVRLAGSGVKPTTGPLPSAEAITDAMMFGRVAEIEKLVDAGVDLNMTIGKDSTLLGLAAYFGHDNIVTLLLDAGADVNVSPGGVTPLYDALLQNHTGAAALLRARGARCAGPMDWVCRK